MLEGDDAIAGILFSLCEVLISDLGLYSPVRHFSHSASPPSPLSLSCCCFFDYPDNVMFFILFRILYFFVSQFCRFSPFVALGPSVALGCPELVCHSGMLVFRFLFLVSCFLFSIACLLSLPYLIVLNGVIH